MVGAALSLSGAVLQALLRNPLADPFVLGISSGAALGAVLAILLGCGPAERLWALFWPFFWGAALFFSAIMPFPEWPFWEP